MRTVRGRNKLEADFAQKGRIGSKIADQLESAVYFILNSVGGIPE